jgi:hypothetical protein
MRRRLNLYLTDDCAARIDALSASERITKSGVVEAALLAFFSEDEGPDREGAYLRRLDRLSAQLGKLEHDLLIGIEALALFIRYQLTVTPALPERDQPSARAQGKERFERFVDSLGRRLQQGKTLVQELPFDLTAPRDPDGTDDMRASVTEEVDDDPS